MMIFERNCQKPTKHSYSYDAKGFVWLQPKRAGLWSGYYLQLRANQQGLF